MFEERASGSALFYQLNALKRSKIPHFLQKQNTPVSASSGSVANTRDGIVTHTYRATNNIKLLDGKKMRLRPLNKTKSLLILLLFFQY